MFNLGRLGDDGGGQKFDEGGTPIWYIGDELTYIDPASLPLTEGQKAQNIYNKYGLNVQQLATSARAAFENSGITAAYPGVTFEKYLDLHGISLVSADGELWATYPTKYFNWGLGTQASFADIAPIASIILAPAIAPLVSEFVAPFVSDLIPSFVTDVFSLPISPLDFVSHGSEAILPIAESVASVAEPVLETALQTVSTVSESVPMEDVFDLFDVADTEAWTGYEYVDEFGDAIGAQPILDDAPFNPYASEAGYTGSYLPESADIVGPPAPSPAAPYPVTPYPMPAPGALPSITNIPAPVIAAGAGLPSLPTLANLFKSIFSPSPASAATMPIRYPAGTVLRPGATTPTGARPLAPFSINTSELTKFALPAAIIIGGLYFISRKKKGA